MTNLDSILKSRDITLATKVHLVKAMVFPVVMYGCENWTVKKADRRRIDAFELWCWRRLLWVPWNARRSNYSILKEISPGCSLEGLMLKLKLHYFGHLMWKADSIEKTLMLGKIEGRRRRGPHRTTQLDGITDSMEMGLGKLRELLMDREAWRATVHEVTKSQTRLSNWTELKYQTTVHGVTKSWTWLTDWTVDDRAFWTAGLKDPSSPLIMLLPWVTSQTLQQHETLTPETEEWLILFTARWILGVNYPTTHIWYLLVIPSKPPFNFIKCDSFTPYVFFGKYV